MTLGLLGNPPLPSSNSSSWMELVIQTGVDSETLEVPSWILVHTMPKKNSQIMSVTSDSKKSDSYPLLTNWVSESIKFHLPISPLIPNICGKSVSQCFEKNFLRVPTSTSNVIPREACALAPVQGMMPQDANCPNWIGTWKPRRTGKKDTNIPSLKLTYPLKIGILNRKVVFQPSIFRCQLLVSGRVSIF